MSLLKKYEMGQLTTEAVRTQDDEQFIRDMINHVSLIKKYILDNSLTVESRIDNDIEFKKLINNLNTVMSTRFGLTHKMITSTTKLLGTSVVSPPEHNVVMGATDQYYDFLDKYFKNKKPVSDVTNLEKDEESYYNTIHNNYKSLKNKLETSNIIVDLKEAKIHNAPNNLIVFIYFSVDLFNTKYDLTVEEIVAGLLHEVGHTFTTIENSYRHIINTSVLLETIHETVRVKNGSPLDAIKLSYKRLTNEDLKETNVISAAIALKNKYRTVAMNNDDNYVLTTTDSESLADQFTSRFLLGDSLASGLSKLGGGDRPILDIELMHMNFKENLVINSILTILLLPVLGMLLPLFVFILTITNIGELRAFNNTNRVYDKFNRRLLKVKQDATRQLRLLKSSNGNEQTINKLVTIISSVDKTISLHKDNKSSVTKFIEKFEFNKESDKLLTFSDTVNNLIENDLYYTIEKI